MENDLPVIIEYTHMSKFKGLVEKLQKILEERSEELEMLACTCRNFTELMNKVNDSELVRRTQIS